MGTERATETVRKLQSDIISGRWPLHGRIPTEGELAAELGVGRSTVREAVRSLAHLGMLEPSPGRGTFVRALDPVSGVLADFASGQSREDADAVRRTVLERAARKAATRRTDEDLARLRAAHDGNPDSTDDFGAVLVAAAESPLLAALYDGLTLTDRAGDPSAGDQTASSRNRSALLAALIAGDADGAAEQARAWVDSVVAGAS